MAVIYNPLDPEVHADPYPHYRLLREEDPVHLSPLGFWVISRYADVSVLLRDPRLGHELDGSMDGASMLFRDPPAHTRLRSLVSRAFTPRMLERFRSRIREIVDESVVRARQTGKMDVIADLAFPLPATVIKHLSFGGGIHFCLGSALARMEGQIAIGSLVSMFDDFAFDPGALCWREHINLRGLESLTVEAA